MVIHDALGSATVVECKHQPSTPIGRPMVQKLHSAVISSKARRGIIVTTGKYTDTAIEHAKELSRETQIDLFTLNDLVALAQQAGMDIIASSQAAKTHCLSCPSDQEAYDEIKRKVSRLQSHPNRPAEMVSLSSHKVILRPCYIMKVDISKDFYSGRDVVIHSVDDKNVRLMVDGVTGKVVDHDTASAVCESALAGSSRLETKTDVLREGFAYDVKSAKLRATESVCHRYSKLVSYRGRNNVGYQKDCKVPPSSVYFADIKPALLPTHVMKVHLLESAYPCKIIDGGGGTITALQLDECAICEKTVDGNPALCNSCGSIYHPRRFFRGHGYRCKSCGKTICQRCAYRIPRAVFFSKIVCEECAALCDAAPESMGGAKKRREGKGEAGKEADDACSLDASIGVERSDRSDQEEGRRDHASERRRRTVIKVLKIAGIAAGIIALASAVVFVALAQTKRK